MCVKNHFSNSWKQEDAYDWVEQVMFSLALWRIVQSFAINLQKEECIEDNAFFAPLSRATRHSRLVIHFTSALSRVTRD